MSKPILFLIAHAAHVASRVAHDWELLSRIFTALADQSGHPQPGNVTALGRSLRFGRCCGAVAVLGRAELLDDDGGQAALAACGFEGPDCERIWARLARQLAAAGPPGKA